MDNRSVYEKKVYDAALPAELFYEKRRDEGLYFWSHWHEEVEILYVTEGMSRIILEQQEYILKKGSMIIINSNELHSGYCLRTPYVCRVISFNPANLSAEIASSNIVFQTLIKNDAQVDHYIEQMFLEYEQQKLAYKDSCKALLTELLIYLSRNYAAAMFSDAVSDRRKRNLERMNQVLLYIEEHYPEDLTSKELANMMYLSKDRFDHLFRENVGVSPQQYINTVRLQKARELIQAGDNSITEIARMVGFTDYNNFGRQFKRTFGCTPRELQKTKLLTKNPEAKKKP